MSDMFVNPYTFIGLGESKSRSSGNGKYTGVLSCTMMTLTPLIIPNAANEHAFSKREQRVVDRWNKKNSSSALREESGIKSYDFYSYDNPEGDRENKKSSPVIPGSSIRGMIRSAYEALTDSCLSTIDLENKMIDGRQVGDVIGHFAPCKDSTQLCDACNLFGMVGENDKRKYKTDTGLKNKLNTVASRVMFRDATTSLDLRDWHEEPMILAILEQPNPSQAEAYYKGSVYPVNGIKGRKFYWHSDDPNIRKQNDPNNLNLTVIARAVKAGCMFTFDIAFENLTDIELAKLIWIISIGGKTSSNEGSTHGFKLGRGKPISFGSVGISIDYDKSGVFVLDESLNIFCDSSMLAKLPRGAEYLRPKATFVDRCKIQI